MIKEVYTGLSLDEAEKRLKNNGKNIFREKKKKSIFKLFLEQFCDVIIIMLLIGAVISLFLGEIADSIVIMAIVVINGFLGFIQEYKTEKSLEALKKMSSPLCNVIRDGKEIKMSTENVVVGDVVSVSAGDTVPADCEIISYGEVSVSEAVLTGESVPVEKNNGDKIYMGTGICSGKCVAQVFATGMNTKMGSIADMLFQEEDETPLKKRLNKIGHVLVVISLFVCTLIAFAGIYHGQSLKSVFFSAVSLAVAAIPEGLPAAVTLCLAIGVRRMLKRNALVRKLPAVETLGCTTVICSDKTGTLTENKMKVTKIYTESYEDDGKNPEKFKNLSLMVRLCLDENIETSANNPTEKAIYEICKKEDISKYMRKSEVPFTSERKYMEVTHSYENEYITVIKGAPDVILKKCEFIMGDLKPERISRSKFLQIEEKINEMAQMALRIIGVAFKKSSGEYIFVGLIGLLDPPRKEVKEAIEKCYRAGIRPVMITGDHILTAKEIADQVGIDSKNSMTGEELDMLSDKELEKRVNKINIYARVTPRHKMRVVRALKKMGNIVAMTGDGVNDAPALKEADIGIAMGKSGTQVAKEAANMVLTDDNFSSIVNAVEEGRIIYNNIRKFIKYLLACNLGEILLMGLCAFMGLPVPLLPIQILWVNLVTDGLPALALGMCKGEKNIMETPPRNPQENIFSGGLGKNIVISGVIMGAASLVAFVFGYRSFGDLIVARTCCFAVLIISEMFFAIKCRNETSRAKLFENKFLIGAVLLSVILMLMVMKVPFLSRIFMVTMPDFNLWIKILALSLIEPAMGFILRKK